MLSFRGLKVIQPARQLILGVRRQRSAAMADIERQYAYRPRWSHILLLAGFCTLLAASVIARASPEDLGLLYWIVLVVSFAGVAWSGVLAGGRLFFRRRVAFTSISLLLPKPWSFW